MKKTIVILIAVLFMSLGGPHKSINYAQNLIVDYVSVTDLFENGCYYLGDFESRRQCLQIFQGSSAFGKISENNDLRFVTHGNQSLKIEILGAGETNPITLEQPYLRISTYLEYFEKIDFSDCKKFMFDIYSCDENDAYLRFGVNSRSSSVLIKLKHGWNNIELQSDDIRLLKDNSLTNINGFYFYFDRGELHNYKQIFYLDNFRAQKR